MVFASTPPMGFLDGKRLRVVYLRLPGSYDPHNQSEENAHHESKAENMDQYF